MGKERNRQKELSKQGWSGDPDLMAIFKSPQLVNGSPVPCGVSTRHGCLWAPMPMPPPRQPYLHMPGIRLYVCRWSGGQFLG